MAPGTLPATLGAGDRLPDVGVPSSGADSRSPPPWRRLLLAPEPIAAIALQLAVWGSYSFDSILGERAQELRGAATWVFLLLLLLACSIRRAGVSWGSRRRERRFWLLFTSAFASWWALESFALFVPAVQAERWAAHLADALYLLFYLLLLLAAQEEPNLVARGDPVEETDRAFGRLGIALLVMGILGYFLLIPATFDPGAYGTLTPSLALYLALDLVLAARFLFLAFAAENASWRALYFALGGALLSWGLVDLMDVIAYGEGLRLDSHLLLDTFWYLPFVGVVVGARWRLAFAEKESETLGGIVEAEVPTRRSDGFLIASLVFVVVHLVGYRTGRLDLAAQAAREVCLIMTVALLVPLSLLRGRSRRVLRERRDENRQRLEDRLQHLVERRTADLQAALREKEVLFLEVHHRVKNNLQMISSLLALQARRARDDASRVALRDACSRIQAMAQVHERIYRADDLAHLDVGGYVESLVRSVVAGFAASGVAVDCRIDVDPDVLLDFERAIPFGLILHELTANAMQHAVSGRSAGVLGVRLERQAPELSLEVRDDGPGLGEEAEEASGLGLELVRRLTRQLGGRLEMRDERGLVVRVVFPGGADLAAGRPGGDAPRVPESA